MDLLELAEEELFGAAKRMTRIMGGVFVLNKFGKRKVRERAAALQSRIACEELMPDWMCSPEDEEFHFAVPPERMSD